MKIEEMIEKLRYKANNIKAKIEPEFFNEVADVLEKQIAKEVIDRVAMIDEFGEYDGDMCKCPKCEVQLYDEGGIFYCHWCGQKLQGFRLE